MISKFLNKVFDLFPRLFTVFCFSACCQLHPFSANPSFTLQIEWSGVLDENKYYKKVEELIKILYI